MNTAEFLRLVLPEQGVYYAVEQHAKGMRHTPCHSTDELAAEVARIDAKGGTSYFACAAYQQAQAHHGKGKKFRTVENQRAARSLWIDIDCGAGKAAAGKGYQTQQKAEEALADFCMRTGFPEPLIVNSGNGLHCYWPLTAELTSNEWRRIADLLMQPSRIGARTVMGDTPRRNKNSNAILIGLHSLSLVDCRRKSGFE